MRRALEGGEDTAGPDGQRARACLPDKHAREFGSMTVTLKSRCSFWPGPGKRSSMGQVAQGQMRVGANV